MNRLQTLWDFQTVDMELEQMENSIKNTEIRKKLIQQQQVFQNNQAILKKLEQESEVMQSQLAGFCTQSETQKKQMSQKNEEIMEIADYDLEDLFIEDVRELVKECEGIKGNIEQNKRKLVEVVHRLEKSETEIKETLMKMSYAKKAFDQLKEEYGKELEAGKDDLERLREKVANAAKSVESDLMEQYKKVKQHRQNPVAHLKNKRCQGCNMELPSGTLQQVKAQEKIILCENCGRILYEIDSE